MKKTATAEEKAKKIREGSWTDIFDNNITCFVLSFIIPFVVMLIALRTKDIRMLWFEDGKLSVNGNNQFLVVDLWHQYFPFFRVVREKLLTGGSFLYSWQNGMGTNFLSLIAYYAASPLNWISVFFKEEYAREALTYILAAKIGFCGSFFNCFLRYTFKRRDLSTVAFSVMFALCSYTLGYYWNVMWFDTIALFPLVMLGVAAMCREGKWKLYTVTLALSLISNYYIGFFTCIFTIFMFAASAIIDWQGIKTFFNRIWLIVRSSVIGIGLGGFILLPAYLALQLTYSANNTFPKEVQWAEKWQDIFANLLSYSPPTAKEGLPNLACGMLAITLLGVFLFSAGIKIREKIAAVLMMALIVVSCNMNQLNFIWHGFHVTNQLPYRYSFIFSFVLVAAAYRAYDIMTAKGIKLYQIPMLLIGPGALLYMCWLSDSKTEEGFSFSDVALRTSLIISGAYVLIFICMKFVPIRDKKLHRTILNIAVTAVVVTELSKNAVIGVETVGCSDYRSYPSYNTEVQTVMDRMEEKETSPFYRMEMTGTYTLNDSSLYGYHGLSQFSSSANVSVTRLFQRLGLYGSEAGNRYYYRTATPVANSILGVKYVMSKLGEMKCCSAFLEPAATEGSVYLYENKYPLSLGFMMDDAILDVKDNSGLNTFEYQNNIMQKASGIDVSLYYAQPVTGVTYNNVTINKSGYGDYSFTVENKDSKASAVYEYAGVNGGYLYGFVKGSGVDTINVENDGVGVESGITSKGYSIAYPMGDCQEGSTAAVTVNFEDDSDYGSFTLVTYCLNEENFKMVYDRLADEQFEITEFSDTEIKGNITANKSGVLYFSIPYEKGWSVYIDGEKAETFPVLQSMLGVKAEGGTHEITLKYSPDGFTAGLIVSGGALLLFVVFAFVDMKKKRRTAESAATEPEAETEEISAEAAEEDSEEESAVSDAENVETEAEPTETEENNEESEGNNCVSGD